MNNTKASLTTEQRNLPGAEPGFSPFPSAETERRFRMSDDEQIAYIESIRPVIERVCSAVPEKPLYSAVKRLVDIIASLLAIILLSPVFAAVAVKIRAESPGAAIYRQKRVGQNGRIFTMYKFRSMYSDADSRFGSVLDLNNGSSTLMFKADNDPRITPFGDIIRRYSLDELPQLFNILRGDMSFVGPRPPLVREVVQYEPEWTVRLAVKGGLTGLWQVNDRNTADFAVCLKYDREYMDKRGLLYDFWLILRTVGVVFKGSGE